MNSYKSGDTIRLLCEFRDFSDALSDPELIKIKIYDQKYLMIDEISVPTTSKESSGNYFYDYTIPSEYLNQSLYYEWYAEISGKPSLNRGQFKVVFI